MDIVENPPTSSNGSNQHKEEQEAFYPCYEKWIHQEAHILAPKVQLAVQPKPFQDHHNRKYGNDPPTSDYYNRGLVAKEIIHPGERVLWIPSSSLLHSQMLREYGSALFMAGLPKEENEQEREQEQEREENGTCIEWKWKLEQQVIVAIELFRRFQQNRSVNRSQQESNSDPSFTIHSSWRDDDALALYLIAARRIVLLSQFHNEKLNKNTTMVDSIVDPSLSDETPCVMARRVIHDNHTSMTNHHDIPMAEYDPDATIDPTNLHDAQFQPSSHSILSDSSVQRSSSSSTSPPSFLPHVQMLPTSFPTHPLFYTQEEMSHMEGTHCHGFLTRMKLQMESDWKVLTQSLQDFYHYHHYHYHFEQEEVEGLDHSSHLIWVDNHGHDSCNAFFQLLQRDMEQDKEKDFHKDANKIMSWNITREEQYLEKTFASLEEYQWALSNIYSRGTDMIVTGEEEEGEKKGETTIHHPPHHQHHRIIAPFLDMINHDFHGQVEHSMDTEGNFSVFNTSSSCIEIGQEICFCYGHFGNDKFLLAYGFVIPENPYNVVPIYAPIPYPADSSTNLNGNENEQEDTMDTSLDPFPLYTMKIALLRDYCHIPDPNQPHLLMTQNHPSVQEGQQDDPSNSLVSSDSVLPNSLLSALRVIGIQSMEEIVLVVSSLENKENSQDPDLQPPSPRFSFTSVDDSRVIPMISWENEYNALYALHEALHLMARKVALNLIQDTVDTNQHHHDVGSTTVTKQRNEQSMYQTINFQNILTLVESEYNILMKSLEEIQERIAQLEDGDKSHDKRDLVGKE